MIDGPEQSLRPRPAIERLGLANVAQTVGKQDLRMCRQPAEEGPREHDEQADPWPMLLE